MGDHLKLVRTPEAGRELDNLSLGATNTITPTAISASHPVDGSCHPIPEHEVTSMLIHIYH